MVGTEHIRSDDDVSKSNMRRVSSLDAYVGDTGVSSHCLPFLVGKTNTCSNWVGNTWNREARKYTSLNLGKLKSNVSPDTYLGIFNVKDRIPCSTLAQKPTGDQTSNISHSSQPNVSVPKYLSYVGPISSGSFGRMHALNLGPYGNPSHFHFGQGSYSKREEKVLSPFLFVHP